LSLSIFHVVDAILASPTPSLRSEPISALLGASPAARPSEYLSPLKTVSAVTVSSLRQHVQAEQLLICVAVSKLTKSKVSSRLETGQRKAGTRNTDKRETLDRLTFSRRTWNFKPVKYLLRSFRVIVRLTDHTSAGSGPTGSRLTSGLQFINAVSVDMSVNRSMGRLHWHLWNGLLGATHCLTVCRLD